MLNACGSDLAFVRPSSLARWSVQDQLNVVVFQVVDQVGVTFGQLLHSGHGNAGFFQTDRGALGGQQFEAQFDQRLAE